MCKFPLTGKILKKWRFISRKYIENLPQQISIRTSKRLSIPNLLLRFRTHKYKYLFLNVCQNEKVPLRRCTKMESYSDIDQ